MRKQNKKGRNIIIGASIFCLLLIIYTWSTYNISVENLEELRTSIDLIEKKKDERTNDYSIVIQIHNGKIFTIPGDHVNCVNPELFDSNFQTENVVLKYDSYDARALLNDSPFIYSIVSDGKEYIDDKCLEESRFTNVIYALVFSLVIIPLFVFAYYMDKNRDPFSNR